MSIKFNKKENLLRIENKNISYIIGIENETKTLIHLYYGIKKEAPKTFELHKNDPFSWGKFYINSRDEIIERPFSPDHYSFEVPTNGDFDKRGSLITIKQSDGSVFTDFHYIEHKIYKGLPKLVNFPCAHGDLATSVDFTLVDAISKVTLVLTYSIFDNKDIILRTGKLINNTLNSVNILKMNSISLDFSKENYDLIHFAGDWARERHLKREPLIDGEKTIHSLQGKSGNAENPFMIICTHNTTENKGICYGFNIIYSGNFKAKAHIDKFEQLRFSLGINDENFSYPLTNGETIEIPQGILAFSNKGLNNLSNNLHNFVRENIVNFDTYLYRPLIFNSWEGCYFDFNTESIIEYMTEAKKIGTELFVLDDGWFGKRNSDNCSLGDWFVNEEKINLKKVIDYCHSLDMKFGLWFEPEMISPDSELFRNHPNWAVGHQGVNRSLERNQLLLDIANPEVVDYIANAVNNILDNYEIDYVKWDHNSSYFDTYSTYLPYEKQSAFDYLTYINVYKLFGKIINTHPNVFFEGCSAGGARFDLGVLSFFYQIWTSDNTDALDRIKIQYGTSYGYPLCTMSSHVSKAPSTSYSTKADVALFGTYGYEFNPTLLVDKEKDQLQKNLNIYKTIHDEVILNGDLYRLSSPFDTDIFAQISVSKDKKKALMIIVPLKDISKETLIKVIGLNKDYSYTCETEQNIIFNNMKITITRANKNESMLIVFKA